MNRVPNLLAGCAFAMTVSLLSTSCSSTGTTAANTKSADERWFADHGVTFVYPDEWESFLEEHRPQPPAWGFIRTPDTSSGNWLAFYYYPTTVAADLGLSDPDSFDDFLAGFLHEGGLTLTHGPSATTIAGLEGREFGAEGLITQRPDDRFESEFVLLFGEEATYGLQVQYEPGSRDIMLSAWQSMLSKFNISSS